MSAAPVPASGGADAGTRSTRRSTLEGGGLESMTRRKSNVLEGLDTASQHRGKRVLSVFELADGIKSLSRRTSLNPNATAPHVTAASAPVSGTNSQPVSTIAITAAAPPTAATTTNAAGTTTGAGGASGAVEPHATGTAAATAGLRSTSASSRSGTQTLRRTMSIAFDERLVERVRAAADKSADFSFMSLDAVCAQFGTDPVHGLTTRAADTRLAQLGRNELAKDPPKPMWRLVLEQLSDLLVLMLIAAAIVSGALGHIADTCVIIVIVILNAILGVMQETRATAALEALSALTSPHCEVIRNGKSQTIDSELIVPGDIVILESGNRIPADIRLLESKGLLCNEQSLTGEPESVPKDALWIGIATARKASIGRSASNADATAAAAAAAAHAHSLAAANAHASVPTSPVSVLKPIPSVNSSAAAGGHKKRSNRRDTAITTGADSAMTAAVVAHAAANHNAPPTADRAKSLGLRADSNASDHAPDHHPPLSPKNSAAGSAAASLPGASQPVPTAAAAPKLKSALHHSTTPPLAVDTSAAFDEKSGLFSPRMSVTAASGGPRSAAAAPSSSVARTFTRALSIRAEETLKPRNMVFMGCTIADGRARGVVVSTGMRTEMGGIAEMLEEAEEKPSPLQEKLAALGKRLGLASLTVSAIVFAIGVATGRGSDPASSDPLWLQMLLVAVSLTVAAVPEGLPVCVTITLAIGMSAMVKRQALVRSLRSVETLGAATVICTDKTGTLTKGVMTAVRSWTPNSSPATNGAGDTYRITGAHGYEPTGDIIPASVASSDSSGVMTAIVDLKRSGCMTHYYPFVVGALCSNAALSWIPDEKRWECRGNSTDRPIVVAAAKFGFAVDSIKKQFPRIVENPFSSNRKMMSVLCENPNLSKSAAAAAAPPPAAEHKSAHPPASTTVAGAAKSNGANAQPPIVLPPAPPLVGAPFLSTPYFAAVKGAPHVTLERCVSYVDNSAGGAGIVRPMTDEQRNRVLGVIDRFSAESYRVLAVAYQPLATKPEPLSAAQIAAQAAAAAHNELFPAASASGIPAVSPGGTGADALERELVLVGLIASVDPEREEVAASIQKAAAAGVRTVMITGDYVKTAKAIGEKIGLLAPNAPEEKAVDCEVLRKIVADSNLNALESELNDLKEETVLSAYERERMAALKSQVDAIWDRLAAVTHTADIYARAQPNDKMTIVRSFQHSGHVCSMTGDGVNDAPALKQADIGVAMGLTGTDVAKAAAGIVLVDDNFCSIVDAIEEGRTIYANIQKFIFYLLSTNVSEVFVILIAVLLGLQSPLVPIQILWLNLATDGAPAVALAFEAREPGTMEEGPRPRSEPLVDRIMIVGVIIQTFVLTGMCLAMYIIGLYWETGAWNGVNHTMTSDEIAAAVDRARTLTALYIVFAELCRSYSSRSLRVSIWRMGVCSNTYLQYAVGTAIAATLFIALTPAVRDVFSLVPLSGREWGLLIGLSPAPFVVDELTKAVYRATGFAQRKKIVHISPSAAAAAAAAAAASTTNAPIITAVTVIPSAAGHSTVSVPPPSHAIDMTPLQPQLSQSAAAPPVSAPAPPPHRREQSWISAGGQQPPQTTEAKHNS